MRFPRQLTLRTFAVLCVAIALCLAYWGASAKKQQQVANAITERGGRVTYHRPSGFIPRFMISALGHDYFCAIDGVTLYPTAESPADEQIAVLGNYPELKNLAIWPGSKGFATAPTDPPGGLSDQGVDLLLTNNPNLRHLSLLAARITNEAEQKLLQATSIESLQYQTHTAYGERSGAQPRNWDYKVVYINKLVGDAKDDVTDIDEIVTGLQNGLKEQGDQGWELCLEINGGVVFKRPR